MNVVRRFLPALWTLLVASLPYTLLLLPDRRSALYIGLLMLPYVAAAALAALAARLNERRAFACALALGAAYAFFRVPRSELLPLYAATAAAAFPAAVALLHLVPRTWSDRAGWTASVSFAAFPFVAAAAALRFAPDLVAPFFYDAAGGLASQLSVPRSAFAMALAAPASVLFVRDRFQRDFGVFAACCAFPICLAATQLVQPGGVEAAVAGFLSSAAVLAYGTSRLYWHKIYWDELTGIPNRRALNERLNNLGRHFTLVMIDIDRFKTFNDTYGHDEGDHVLRFVAKHFEQESGGQAYRYGGEEFCVVFENMEAETAAQRMEAMRKKLSSRTFIVRAPGHIRARTTKRDRAQAPARGEKVRVTVSAGVASSGSGFARPDDVLIAADTALYRAKDLGRDRVLIAQVEVVPKPLKKKAL